MTDFNLEQAVKPFVDDVHRALAGFEGKAASLTDVIEELKHEQAALRRGALFGAPLMDGNKAAVTPAEKAALVEFIKSLRADPPQDVPTQEPAHVPSR
jgi:hypothetical protein